LAGAAAGDVRAQGAVQREGFVIPQLDARPAGDLQDKPLLAFHSAFNRDALGNAAFLHRLV
jgi:hypothetical protein